MGPDSAALVVLMWAVAVLVFVGVVALGPRIARRSFGMFMARSGAQLVGSLVLLLAVAATLNAQYGWYADWSDVATSVTGQAAETGATTRGGATAARHNTVADKKETAVAVKEFGKERADFMKSHLKSNPGPDGQYVHVHVPGLGTAAGRAGDLLIWVPRSYTDPSQQDRAYPVIEAFHGIPGGNHEYQNVLAASRVVGDAVDAHQLSEAIVVAPDYSPSNIDTECVDAKGINMETFVTKMVPAWVVSHLRVQNAAGSWATFGYSSGGWCAAMAAVLHPDRYGAAILLGAYYAPFFERGWVPFTAANIPARYRILDQIVKHPPNLQIWLEISGQDALSTQGSERLVKSARAPTSVTTITLPHAGHRMGVWRPVVPTAMAWLGMTMPAFAPGH